MQSVCIKASGYDMPKTKKLEDTTLIGLTFGGYLRSKVLLTIRFVFAALYIVFEELVVLIVCFFL